MRDSNLPDEMAVLVRQGCSAMNIELTAEDGIKLAASVRVNGVWHHFERVKKEVLVDKYTLDDDPDYDPQCDEEGYCYIMVPFNTTNLPLSSA